MNPTSLVTDTLVTGLPYVPVIMGIYVVFRMRDDFDLTVNGSFVSGGAVGAEALTHGLGVPLAMLLAFLAAGAAGAVTTLLHVALRIPVLLASLATSIGLYSINLHILSEIPTVALGSASTLFTRFGGLSASGQDWATIGVLAVFAVFVLTVMGLFLRTEIGLAIRVSGTNVRLARSQGVHEKGILALSLLMANGLAGLSGILVVQQQGYVDVSMGVGTLLAAVGAALLGELFTRPSGSQLLRIMCAMFIGAIAYQFILVFALQAGLAPGDLNLAQALTLVAAFAANRLIDGVRLSPRSILRGRAFDLERSFAQTPRP